MFIKFPHQYLMGWNFVTCCIVTYKKCYEMKVRIAHIVDYMIICLLEETRENLQFYLCLLMHF
jgi:hypothetical protein